MRTPIRYALSLVFFALLASGANAEANNWRVDDAERVVAISDIHGAYDAMVSTLQNVGVLDRELAWAGGKTHLVIVGDILDRGPRSRDAMDLLMRLEGEAESAGGYVHVLIGNHESMNMIGDLRYVSKEEYAAFADEETSEQRRRWLRAYIRRFPLPRNEQELEEKFEEAFPPGYFALRDAFSPDGKYGSWLLSKPIIVVINGTAFVHGGLSPVVAEYGLDGVNTALQQELAAYVRSIDTLIDAEVLLPIDSHYDYTRIVERYLPKITETSDVLTAAKAVRDLEEASLINTGGPLWYRANVACNEIIEKHRLDKALAALGADRVVVGHTPTPERKVMQRFDGRLIEIDTGMLNFYYRGSGSALVLSGASVMVHNQHGDAAYAPLPQHRAVGSRPHNMSPEDLASLLRSGEVVASTKDSKSGRTIVDISDGDHAVKAIFTRRRGRGFYPDAAAYKLDRMLGLDMVPVSVRREVDGKDGTVQFLPPKIMDEGERSAAGRGARATCPLPEQFMAMYVFDVLVYNEGRTMERMIYDTRSWDLMLLEHERAFATKKGRPRHLSAAPIEISDGWKVALGELTDDVLNARLGDVLDAKRIRALATRRDEILAR